MHPFGFLSFGKKTVFWFSKTSIALLGATFGTGSGSGEWPLNEAALLVVSPLKSFTCPKITGHVNSLEWNRYIRCWIGNVYYVSACLPEENWKARPCPIAELPLHTPWFLLSQFNFPFEQLFVGVCVCSHWKDSTYEPDVQTIHVSAHGVVSTDVEELRKCVLNASDTGRALIYNSVGWWTFRTGLVRGK